MDEKEMNACDAAERSRTFEAPRVWLWFGHGLSERAMIDSGAEVSLLTKSAWKRLKNVVPAFRVRPWAKGAIVGVGDGRAQPLKKVTMVLPFGSQRVAVAFALVSHAPEEIILGADFLNRAQCVLDAPNRCMVVRGEKVPVEFAYRARRFTVVATSTFDVPPLHRVQVVGRVRVFDDWGDPPWRRPGGCVGLVFPLHQPSSYTFAASALSQPISKSERHISVQLTNFDRSKSQHFEPGQPIAVWERFDEDEPSSSSSEGEEEKDRAVDVPSAKSLVSPIPDLKRLQSEQLADPELRRFIGDLRSGASSVPDDLHLKDGVLWHTWTPPVESGIRPGTRWQVVLPSSQRDEILAQYHDENGHGNAQRTLHQIREKYWWPRMFEQIRRYVASCDTCQRHAPKPRTKGTYRAWAVRDRFQEWHVDIAGPLPESSSGNRYFVTCVDAATGEPVAEAIRQADAESVVRVLKDRVFLKHGPPRALLTDRGAQFMGNLWDEVARRLGTKLKFTSPFRPSTNGRCERMNGTIKNILKRLCGHLQRDWDLHLQEAVCSILHAPNRTLKEAPYFLVYGQEPRFALEQMLEIPSRPTPKSRLTLSEEGLSILESMDKAMELVYRNVREAQRARQLAWDQSHKNVKFEVGSEVLYWRPVPVGGGEGRSTSLAALWSGPYRIEKATGPLNYRIVGVDNPADTHVVHVSRLKPYVRRQSDFSAPTPANHFEIEDILDQRSSSEGIEYLVKWRGFSHRYNSWVRREDLAADELLERFERERAAASSEPQIASNPRSRSERTQEALSPQTSDKGRVRESGKSPSVPTSAPSEPPPLVSRSGRFIKPPSRLDL